MSPAACSRSRSSSERSRKDRSSSSSASRSRSALRPLVVLVLMAVPLDDGAVLVGQRQIRHGAPAVEGDGQAAGGEDDGDDGQHPYEAVDAGLGRDEQQPLVLESIVDVGADLVVAAA